MTRPIVWSIAGTDSGGGAGLAADLRMADAFGVHLCTVVSAITAQHSGAVTCVEPVRPELLLAQADALADDMPPAAIKTGLLGGVAQVHAVARIVDRLRERAPVALIVDPVLGATTGARFADDDTLHAYREALLPRASLVTPNRREAERLAAAEGPVPAVARRLQAQAACVTGGDSADVGGRVLDWLASEHAQGWLASPRVDTPHHHGSGCSFAMAAASAMALGFVAADAVVLAKMATTHALRHGYRAGAGAGPVHAQGGFAADPTLLPLMSWGEAPRVQPPAARAQRRLGLYAIVDSADRVADVLAAGVRTLQLRMKTSDDSKLRPALQAAIAACRDAGAELFVNDHWRLAHELGAAGVHLGQEDLLALGEDGRRALLDSGLALGISSHSLWELCRARSLAPRYVACGPVWPTLTKTMPWRPQGLDNLAWWQRMAGVPVVAIGGILEPWQAQAAARCGVDGVCVVRALGDDPGKTVPAFERAARGLPHPSLGPASAASRAPS
ncbi:bifunctional hydroxymethylpyrimidine kinase/phosphomethylpyrimidine kinase [Piscinibacter sp. XHJ-5]|uniref:bifunctional hydroxymethylpyrimidine kinase/phosphomethylpyrimidine kinase n=1 Tax=Piscinibacter sp. XHJ-5 TaxID=3037797 RepID=UPI00245339C3|nr:bifunctional hydroxymethylpyrimidine kinase/phosphomethylpyrimidine kinase [Piscinibacter sp. XHJ-5]